MTKDEWLEVVAEEGGVYAAFNYGYGISDVDDDEDPEFRRLVFAAEKKHWDYVCSEEIETLERLVGRYE